MSNTKKDFGHIYAFKLYPNNQVQQSSIVKTMAIAYRLWLNELGLSFGTA